MVTLEGLAFEEQSTRAGLYQKTNKGYYVKDVSTGTDQAIWNIYGAWAIGPLDNVNTTVYGLSTTQPMSCPYSKEAQWQVYDGEDFVEVDNIVRVTEWNQGNGLIECLSTFVIHGMLLWIFQGLALNK